MKVARIVVLFGFTFAMGAVACGSGDNASTTGAPDAGPDAAEASTAPKGPTPPDNPVGTVGGLILDVAGDAPLANVSVNIDSAGTVLSAKTDANGLFSIGNVPSGPYILTTTLSGYESALVTGTLSGAQGNDVVANPISTVGPIGLFATTGTFPVRIVDDNGAPVANVKVVARPQVRYFDDSSGTPLPQGAYSVAATSGADGKINLTGLPDYASFGSVAAGVSKLPIDVAPVQVMGSSTYSFPGGTFTFDLLNLVGTGGFADQVIITLAGPKTDLTILDSNIQYLRGQDGTFSRGFNAAAGTVLLPTDPITIVFNQSIAPSSVRASLINEDGSTSTTALTPSVAQNVLTLTPAAALTAGARYNLALHADAVGVTGVTNTMRSVAVTAPFFIKASASPQIVAASAKLSADKLSFTFQFSEPIGVGLGSAAGVSCIVYYEGVNLDGDPTSLYPGEYGPGLTCPNVLLDIKQMSPLEPTSLPVTGFSSRWSVTFDNAGNGGCKAGVVKGAGCTVPAPGTIAHFVFSRTTGPNTIMRADGTPVQDSAAMMIAIPGP